MSETTRIIGPAIPYDAAVASAKYGLFLKTESYMPDGTEEFVQVTSVGQLHSPPRGPWYEVTVRNNMGVCWQLHVYLGSNARTERLLGTINFVTRP